MCQKVIIFAGKTKDLTFTVEADATLEIDFEGTPGMVLYEKEAQALRDFLNYALPANGEAQ